MFKFINTIKLFLDKLFRIEATDCNCVGCGELKKCTKHKQEDE